MNRTDHLLTCLAEECGEVAKECHKSLRFGLDDQLTLNPNGPRGTEGPTNREKIVDEFIDLLGAYQKCVDEGILPPLGLNELPPPLIERMKWKGEKIEAYIGYAGRVGQMRTIPKLTEMACFQHGFDNPIRYIWEGPNGSSGYGDSATFSGVAESFARKAREAETAEQFEASLNRKEVQQ